MDVGEAGGAAPEDLVAGRRVIGACEVAAELRQLEEVMAEAGW